LTNLHRDAFKELRKLNHLDLSSNQLLAGHPNWFDGKRELQFLSLRHNELNFLESLLDKLEDLQEFDIGQNKFQFIDYNWFASNTRLKKLIMDNNQIKKIKKRSGFSELKHLEWLDLSENNCTNQTFRGTNISFLNNEENCSICRLESFKTESSFYKNASIFLALLVAILILSLCWVSYFQHLKFIHPRESTFQYRSSSFTKSSGIGYYTPDESGFGWNGNSIEMESSTTTNPGYRKCESLKCIDEGEHEQNERHGTI
jgi:hypothetical protein